MGLVQIYDTQEEVLQRVRQVVYESNLKTRETLESLTKAAMSEYREKSGFDERWIRRNEEFKKKKPWASTFPPNMVHLSDDEQKNFKEQYHDLGKDLELTVLVHLSAVGDEYNFDDVSGGIGIGFVGPYKDISSMALDIKDILQQLKGKFSGAKLTPAFYTTKENKPLVPEEISSDVDGWLNGIAQEMQEDDDLPEEAKTSIYEELREFASSKDRYGGLTEAECAEFERLFCQQATNTP
ncbi:MAG: hypothetical protein AABX64_01820 [Nanoarchaeota archaeon]